MAKAKLPPAKKTKKKAAKPPAPNAPKQLDLPLDLPPARPPEPKARPAPKTKPGPVPKAQPAARTKPAPPPTPKPAKPAPSRRVKTEAQAQPDPDAKPAPAATAPAPAALAPAATTPTAPAADEATPAAAVPPGGDDPGAVAPGAADGPPSALRRMMADYFMEYASYVIKERAIPELDDGLKPVQRRILHSLQELDDGRLHKVANIVGNTMKYHPHGETSIYGALVHIANHGYFIDRQGNFGNIYTGDPASAPRYIECRLSPLAREVLFAKELTQYVPTYDGRNLEPVTLPAKVPVLLMQGSEGIAVGMATHILPHNFRELLQAQIKILREEPFRIYPDFAHGGTMDVSEYNKGQGRVRLRAKIDVVNEKTLVIREIPACTTTEALIHTIEEAANKGKLKLASINDYTAETVEIEIKLPRGVYAETTIKALYAYTECQAIISCNCLVIKNNQPVEMNVHEVLQHNTQKLRDDLKRELEVELGHLGDLYHFKTLAQIFIEKRIYQRIEEAKTYEDVKAEVRAGLKPYLKQFIPPAAAQLAPAKGEKVEPRPVTDEDLEKLLQIPIRRISLFDLKKNKDELGDILVKTEEVLKNLRQLTKYTINYLKGLLDKYGDGHPRRTKIENFEEINVREIALQNIKVGLDRTAGFLGTDIKSEEPLLCSEFDRLVVLRWDGVFKVIPIPEKLYVGPVCAPWAARSRRSSTAAAWSCAASTGPSRGCARSSAR